MSIISTAANSSTMFILTDYDKKSFQIDKQYPSKFLTFDMTKNEKASLNFSVEEKSNVALIMVGNTANKYKVCDFVVSNLSEGENAKEEKKADTKEESKQDLQTVLEDFPKHVSSTGLHCLEWVEFP